jgi:hypothetical protein
VPQIGIPALERAEVDADASPHLAESFATGAGLDFDSRFGLAVDILIQGFATRD